VSIASSTIVFNEAYYDNPNRTSIGAGVYFDGAATHSIVNSIIAHNVGGDPTAERDCHLETIDPGNTLTIGYSIVQFPENCPSAGVDIHIDPKVLPQLSDNGGPTPTHYLDATSPARDSATSNAAGGCKDTDGMPLAWDQRGPGFPRVIGAGCDKGAVEWNNVIFADGFQ